MEGNEEDTTIHKNKRCYLKNTVLVTVISLIHESNSLESIENTKIRNSISFSANQVNIIFYMFNI